MTIKNKQYNLLEYIKIPFFISPIKTIILGLNSLVVALIPSIQILATAKFINTALKIFSGTAEQSQIYFPLSVLIILMAYGYIAGVLMNMLTTRLQLDLTEDIKLAIVEKRGKLEYRYIENDETWELIKRVCNEPDNKIFNGLNNLLSLIGLIISVVSIMLILIVQVWWVAIVVIVVCVPLFYLAIKTGKQQYEDNKEAVKYTRRAEYLKDVLTSRENVEERALFGYTNELNDKWYEQYELARKIETKAEAKRFIKGKGAGLITLFISVFICAMLIKPLATGAITVGMFIALVTATFSLVQNLSWTLPWVTGELAVSKEYMVDMTKFSALLEVPDALALPDSKIQDLGAQTIEFKDVSFAYPNTEKYILKHLTLKLEPHKHYAFVGVNGAGKTTITKILTGMYDNYEGEILIGGKELRTYSLAEIKGMFSVVFQDFAKYYVSMKENILLGDLAHDTHDECDMQSILNSVELTETVEKLPQGLDTYLGKIKTDSVDISGGQWQKIAIARALYNKAPMRILDEPTAALDPVAESKIYEMFDTISKGVSTIFITHRLGAARLAEQIVVIDNGAVSQKGSHDELVLAGGIYHDMWAAQKGWYE